MNYSMNEETKLEKRKREGGSLLYERRRNSRASTKTSTTYGGSMPIVDRDI